MPTYEDAEEVDERRFNRFVNLGITAEDMAGFLDESVTMRDLEPFAEATERVPMRARRLAVVVVGVQVCHRGATIPDRPIPQ